MKRKSILYGEKIFLKVLQPEDVTESYVSWLNDAEINQYLESRFNNYDLHSCQEFVANMSDDSLNILWGIFCQREMVHIGNIKLGPIECQYQRGTIGLLIGEREYWGKGIATEVIQIVSNYGFKQLELNKIEAGCYQDNVGSKKAFLRAGFKVEGVLKEHFIVNGRFQDKILLGKVKPA